MLAHAKGRFTASADRATRSPRRRLEA